MKKWHDKLFIFTEKFLSSSILGDAYIKFFERATLEEFEMVDICEDDEVLHIGCGALPNTLISLAKNIPAHYTGIDRDEEAVEIARRVVRRYNLTNVRIEYGDAMDYPLNGYDLIIISFGVGEEEKVFERIRREAKEGAKVIYRKQWDFMNRIYKREDVPTGFKIMAVHKRRDFIKSYLLTKEI